MLKDRRMYQSAPRAGFLRLGVKEPSSNNPAATKLVEKDHFIFEPASGNASKDKQLLKQFKNIYGDQPKSIRVTFPPAPTQEGYFSIYYKRYGQNKIKCRGDGETAVCFSRDHTQGLEILDDSNPDRLKVKCNGSKCIYQVETPGKKPSCGMVCILNVIIPDIDTLGTFQITTGSWFSAQNLLYFFGLCKNPFGVIVTLNRVPQDIAYQGGKSRTHYILQIETGISFNRLISKARAAVLPSAAAPALPSGDDHDTDAPPIDMDRGPGDDVPGDAPDNPISDAVNAVFNNDHKNTESADLKVSPGTLRRLRAKMEMCYWPEDKVEDVIKKLYAKEILEDLTNTEAEQLTVHIEENPRSNND